MNEKRDSVPGDTWWVTMNHLLLDTSTVLHGALPVDTTVMIVSEDWDHNPESHVYTVLTAKGIQQVTRSRLNRFVKIGYLIPFKMNYAASPAR